MCNDYERQIDWERFCAAMAAARLELPSGSTAEHLPQAEDVRVSEAAPVIVAAGNAVDLQPMVWGLPSARGKRAPVFNFRSEGRRFGESKRCLVPASAFFEFTGRRSPKSKWRFALVGQPVLAIAGLWREGEAGERWFTMLTTGPGEDVKPFHDRQVVVLRPAEWASWLYLGRPESEILRPLPGGSLCVTLARADAEAPPTEFFEFSAQTVRA